jgi:hypothetical protein
MLMSSGRVANLRHHEDALEASQDVRAGHPARFPSRRTHNLLVADMAGQG